MNILGFRLPLVSISPWVFVVSFGSAVPSQAQGSGEDETEFERLVVSYSVLTTLAGIGGEEDGNFWKDEFEGAQAAEIELSNPHMTMADAAGNFYIADKESHSILKVDPNGIVTTFAGTHESGFNVEVGVATEVQLSSPNGLYVLPNGTVYVLDYLNKRVRRVDPSGNMATIFEDGDGFGIGRALWVSPDETTIFYNGPGRVMKWTASSGNKVYTDGLSDPGNLTVDPDGNLVVTDRGAHRVYRVASDGTKTVIAGDGSSDEPVNGSLATEVGLEDVRGVAFRPDGSYFVCTQKGGDVVFVDTRGIANIFVAGRSSGNTHAGDGQPPESPGNKISEPRSVSLAPNGDVIITTNDKGFIRVVKAIPPPRSFTAKTLQESGLVLSWEDDDRYTVMIESSVNLEDWKKVAISDEGDGAYGIGITDTTPPFFRLRSRRK